MIRTFSITSQRAATGATRAVLAALPLVLDDFDTVLMSEVMIWGLFAMGFDVIYGYLGMLSLGQSIFFGTGAYAVPFALMVWGTNLWAALALAVVASAVAALAVGLVAVRTSHLYFLVLTIIVSLVVLLVLQSGHWRWLTGGYGGRPFATPGLWVGPWTVDLVNPRANCYFVLAVVGAAYLLCRRILDSPLGRIFLSIRENEERARLIGYDVERYKLLAFIIAGGVAGLAGGLYAISFRYTNLVFFHWTTSGVAVVSTVVGGAGTLVGAYVGTGVFLLLKEYLSSHVEHANVLIGIILILVVQLAPGGAIGLLRRFWGRYAA